MKRGFVAALVAGLLSTPLVAGAQAPTDRWTFSLQPYVWLPGVDAKLRYSPPPGGGRANVEVEGEDVLEALNFALLLQAEARKGRWLVATDFIYLDLGSENSTVKSIDFNPGLGAINIATTQLNAGTQTSFDAVMWTLVGGYNVVQEPAFTLDLVAGFRYLKVEARTDVRLTAAVTGPAGTQPFARERSIEEDVDLWDAIIGARGRFRFGDGKWFVPYHIDIGAGDSDSTWQGVIGVGYAFSWGEMALSYRHLEYKEGGSLIEKLSFSGPAFGVNFRF